MQPLFKFESQKQWNFENTVTVNFLLSWLIKCSCVYKQIFIRLLRNDYIIFEWGKTFTLGLTEFLPD